MARKPSSLILEVPTEAVRAVFEKFTENLQKQAQMGVLKAQETSK